MVKQVTGIEAHEDTITIASRVDSAWSFRDIIHPNQPQSEKHNLFVMVNFPFLLVKIATDLSP